MTKTNVYVHFIDKQGKRYNSSNGKIVDTSLKISKTKAKLLHKHAQLITNQVPYTRKATELCFVKVSKVISFKGIFRKS